MDEELLKAVREYITWIRGSSGKRAQVPDWLEGAERCAWWSKQREKLHLRVTRELERVGIPFRSSYHVTDIAREIYTTGGLAA